MQQPDPRGRGEQDADKPDCEDGGSLLEVPPEREDDRSDGECEPVFMRYLLARRVPPWARHVAREVHERDRERSLVPRDYGVAPVLPPPAPTTTMSYLCSVIL